VLLWGSGKTERTRQRAGRKEVSEVKSVCVRGKSERCLTKKEVEGQGEGGRESEMGSIRRPLGLVGKFKEREQLGEKSRGRTISGNKEG